VTAPAPSETAGGAAGERIARILLVDDVRRLVDLMKHYLKRTTCRVLTARNGAEALRICRSDRPDLVFLDASLPGMDGIEACCALKSDRILKDIPVVIVTVRERSQECREAGCDEILTKPVMQEEFLKRVRRFVALRERSEERIPASVRVEFVTVSGTYTAYTKDLSAHGAFLKTSRPFAPGTRLKLTIHLSRGRPPLQIAGEVKRMVEGGGGSSLLGGVGLRFIEVQPADRGTLEEFIASRRAALRRDPEPRRAT